MRPLLGTALLLFLWSAEAVAATFATRDDFSVTLPSGWVEAPPEALRNMETAIEELSQGAVKERYDYGYQLGSASTWFEYPYILVQVRRSGRISERELSQYEGIDAEFREGLENLDSLLGDLVSNPDQGETRYDEAGHILWSAITMKVQGVGDVRGLFAVKLTEFGFIQVMGYATVDTFPQYSPVFRDAVRDLEVDERYQYRPRWADRAPTVWGINLGRVAIAALVGGLVAAVVSLVGHLRRKRSHPAA